MVIYHGKKVNSKKNKKHIEQIQVMEILFYTYTPKKDLIFLSHIGDLLSIKSSPTSIDFFWGTPTRSKVQQLYNELQSPTCRKCHGNPSCFPLIRPKINLGVALVGAARIPKKTCGFQILLPNLRGSKDLANHWANVCWANVLPTMSPQNHEK